MLLLLKIGLDLSFELHVCWEVANSGTRGAICLHDIWCVLLGIFVLNNLFPIGTGKEHKVELVFVFVGVVRLRVVETGLAVFDHTLGRLDIGVLAANRVG